MADSPELNEVVTQKGALVGDEAVNAAGTTPEADVVSEEVPAQVAGSNEPASATVRVHETYVVADKVITDPSSPEAVQIPDAGRGSLDLPLHSLADGHVEDRFDAANKEAAKEEKKAAAAPSE